MKCLHLTIMDQLDGLKKVLENSISDEKVLDKIVGLDYIFCEGEL
jgi:hypothetical protein